MFRWIATLGLVSSLLSPAFAEDESALRARIAELERENRRLRGQVVKLTYTQKAQNGVPRDVPIGAGRTLKMIIARDGWGECRPEDVGAVCESCAKTILRAIAPEAGREPTLVVVRDAQGPMVVSQRGDGGEYFVLINSGDRRWSQIAYQFSHELGHVLCGDLSLSLPQLWFEEAFCESLSLWTLEQMGMSWETDAPYENWKSYAPRLTEYIEDVRQRVDEPRKFSDWYTEQRQFFQGQAYDRDKNLVLAKYLADEAHRDPRFYQAFYYLRRGADSPVNSMEWLLANWIEHCPEELRFAPRGIAKTLNVTPHKAGVREPGRPSARP